MCNLLFMRTDAMYSVCVLSCIKCIFVFRKIYLSVMSSQSQLIFTNYKETIYVGYIRKMYIYICLDFRGAYLSISNPVGDSLQSKGQRQFLGTRSKGSFSDYLFD